MVSSRHRSLTSSVDLNAATELLLLGGMSLSNFSRPTVLASQAAWITREPILPLQSVFFTILFPVLLYCVLTKYNSGKLCIKTGYGFNPVIAFLL